MWKNSFETEIKTEKQLIFYEPLLTDAPQTAYPYCCYIGVVIFYNPPFPGDFKIIDEVRGEWNLLGQRFTNEIDGWAGVAPFVKHGDHIYELMSGEVIWRNDQWQKKWTGRRVDENDIRWPFLATK